MTREPKQWFVKNADIIQLITTFSALIAALWAVIENPGRLAILLGLVAVSVGFGATLAVLIIKRSHKHP